MSAFVSKLEHLHIHQSGWAELPGGVRISKLPVFDRGEELFARLGHGPSGEWLRDNGMDDASVAELEQLHAMALHIEPYTLPTGKMLVAAGIPKPWVDYEGHDTPAMAAYRAEHMQTLEWCRLHDAEVFARLAAAGWTVSPIANAGKHWVKGGRIFGWWRVGQRMIQTPSDFHRHEPEYVDYGTTFHAVLREQDIIPDTEPAPRWHDGMDLPNLTLGERCCGWLGFHFGLAPREIPGPEHEPIILAYSEHCVRDGRPLQLKTDDSDSPWCAALASATLFNASLPGEAQPHGLHVSVRELVESARVEGTLRDASWTPTPGSLAILGRAGENPLTGGRGHVRCVIQLDGDRYLGLGGNEDDTISCGWHPRAAVLAWVER